MNEQEFHFYLEELKAKLPTAQETLRLLAESEEEKGEKPFDISTDTVYR